MSVNAVLEKIAKHNDSVLGCLVMAQNKTWHTLPEIYSMVDVKGVTEYAQSMFDVTDSLEGEQLDQIFLEFQNHSIYARRVDDSILVLVNEPIPRTVFKKMQVGVNLFVKPLQRALAEAASEVDSTPAEPQSDTEPQKDRKLGISITRMYRGVKY